MLGSQIESAEITESSAGSRIINIQFGTTTTGNPQDDCRATEEGNASTNLFNLEDNTVIDYVAEEDHHDEDDNEAEMELTSLLSSNENTSFVDNSEKKQSVQGDRRLKNRNDKRSDDYRKQKRRSSDRRSTLESIPDDLSITSSGVLLRNASICCYNGSFCFYRNFKSTLQCMNFMARIVLWCTVLALIVAVIWYSYELHNHG